MTESESRLNRNNVAGGCAAGVIAIGGLAAVLSVGSEIYTGEPGAIPITIYQYFTQDDCRTKLDPNAPIEITTTSPIAVEIQTNRDALHEYANRQAEANNLTLLDESEILDNIDLAPSYEVILEETNKYTQKLGFKVTMPEEPNGLLDFPNSFEPFSQEDFQIDSFREVSKNLLRNLYYIPSELFEKINIRELAIVHENNLPNNPPIVRSNSPRSYFNPVNKKAYVELRSDNIKDFQRAFMFTVGTAVDFETCGIFGAQIDTAIAEFEASGINIENIDTNLDPLLIDKYDLIKNKGYLARNYIFPLPNSRIYDADDDTLAQIGIYVARAGDLVHNFPDYWTSLMPPPPTKQ